MHKSNKKIILDSVIIGSALFAMFFGAGNMIFPPYLGFKSGTEWFTGFLGYYIADIGLAVVAILSQIKTEGHKNLLSPLGSSFGKIMIFVIIMCIGPIISIPRTAATTFELSIQPLMPRFNMSVFYIIFFVFIALLSIKKSAVVDIVGKFLTPVLFVGLLLLIVMGIITPMGEIELAARTESVIGDGIEAGYQSMDVLAAIVFGMLILNSASAKGHTAPSSKAKVVAGAGIVAGIGLLVIYLGLTYLGATASSNYDMHIYRTQLLSSIIATLLPGSFGSVFFAVVAGFACVSTAVALTSAAAEYLEGVTKGKIKYSLFVLIICGFGAIISLLGVESLISFASPILSIVYPPVLVLVVLSFYGDKLGKISRRCGAYTALVFGFFDALSTFGISLEFISALPFANLGLAWVVPSLAVFLIGFAVERLSNYKLNKRSV